ncbi:hypothetical protein BDM02DRAFT_3224734 [Thelephora ganbajun]|uniref:Uncharacterized protein n=1 Tax=Thelephora ganbajun TaxID=370292 RepID=A0ACB6Z1I8_THEGA|nr:hypothetical protein BDM02DRAFT_3224734 [Thelephora ganbajun]
MTPLFVCLAALLPLLTFAYSDSSPVVAWTSRRSKTLDNFSSTVVKPDHIQSILETILLSDDVCRHDAVILVDHPGLRASHLRRLDRNAPIVRRIAAAASSIQIPYTRPSLSDLPFNDFAGAISHHCSAQMVKVQPNEEILKDPGSKYVVPIALNSVDSPATFANVMEKLASAFPDHLIIYSSDSSRFVKRQLEETPDPSSFFTAPNHMVADGGILKRYQLLTPGLILTLIVVFFVLVPIIVLSVNALASIQSPLRAEAPRSFSVKDKKNQ